MLQDGAIFCNKGGFLLDRGVSMDDATATGTAIGGDGERIQQRGTRGEVQVRGLVAGGRSGWGGGAVKKKERKKKSTRGKGTRGNRSDGSSSRIGRLWLDRPNDWAGAPAQIVALFF